ncbi:hypothetical protein HLG78_02740 [Candidatus Absconditicoccus praedator]|nr:hypothetical protein HLG78_02740 [Candidatus Absconditicoccus praedator]
MKKFISFLSIIALISALSYVNAEEDYSDYEEEIQMFDQEMDVEAEGVEEDYEDEGEQVEMDVEGAEEDYNEEEYDMDVEVEGVEEDYEDEGEQVEMDVEGVEEDYNEEEYDMDVEVEGVEEDYEDEGESPEDIYTDEYIEELNFTEIYNDHINSYINDLSENQPNYTEQFEVGNIDWIGSNTARVEYYDGDNQYVGDIELGWWNGEVQFEGYESVEGAEEDYNEEEYDMDVEAEGVEEGYEDEGEQVEMDVEGAEEDYQVEDVSLDQGVNLSEKFSKSIEERENIVDENIDNLVGENYEEFNTIQSKIDNFVNNTDNLDLLEERYEDLEDVINKIDDLNLSVQNQYLYTSVFIYLQNSFESRIEELGGDVSTAEEADMDGGLDGMLEDLLE